MSAAITGKASSAGLRQVELSIQGMTCAACAARVQKKLSALENVTGVGEFRDREGHRHRAGVGARGAAGRGGRAGRLRRGTGPASSGRGRPGAMRAGRG